MRHRLLLSLFLGLFLIAPLAAADDDEAPPFPKPGSDIPGPFHVLNLTGPRVKRYHSLVVHYDLRPVVVVFVHPEGGDKLNDWLKTLDEGQPLATLLKKVDDVAETHPDAMLGAFAVYSANKEDEVALADKLKNLPETQGMNQVIQTLADDVRQKGLEAWKLNPGGAEPEIGVLLYHKHKVVRLWEFSKDKPPTAKDADAIAAAFDKLVPSNLRAGPKAQLKLKRKPVEKREPIVKEPKESGDKPKEKEDAPKAKDEKPKEKDEKPKEKDEK